MAPKNRPDLLITDKTETWHESHTTNVILPRCDARGAIRFVVVQGRTADLKEDQQVKMTISVERVRSQYVLPSLFASPLHFLGGGGVGFSLEYSVTDERLIYEHLDVYRFVVLAFFLVHWVAWLATLWIENEEQNSSIEIFCQTRTARMVVCPTFIVGLVRTINSFFHSRISQFEL